MAADTQAIKTLREKTGAGIMDCKKALLESGGDFDKAIKYLREKGLSDATKRSGREAREGVITVVYSDDGSEVLMVEINTETDFVSRTDKYKEFVSGVASTLLEKGISNVEEIPEDISNRVKEAMTLFGENILVRKLALFKKSDARKSVFQSYIHLDGKAGVIAEFIVEDESTKDSQEFKELTKNIALQIASMSPISVSHEDFPEDILSEQSEIFKKQAMESGKPENIIEKIVMGKIGKFIAENCLVEQKYVKDNEISVKKYINSVTETIGNSVEIKRFARFKLGEE
ncbi:MAG: translation elongation factor Ts [Spirochaetota bacterium]|nr:MAG: translation elongation factor Ts [Spirochaetota bacterium]